MRFHFSRWTIHQRLNQRFPCKRSDSQWIGSRDPQPYKANRSVKRGGRSDGTEPKMLYILDGRSLLNYVQDVKVYCRWAWKDLADFLPRILQIGSTGSYSSCRSRKKESYFLPMEYICRFSYFLKRNIEGVKWSHGFLVKNGLCFFISNCRLCYTVQPNTVFFIKITIHKSHPLWMSSSQVVD
jgi:hypothetical protein